MPDPSPGTPKKPVKIAPPTGTRDFYPREMLVRRYITDAWRRTALRHGFDEIDGPTFESAELYKVKSGEGILNEMFGVFSGKADGGRRKAEEESNEPHAPASGSADPSPSALRLPPYGLRPEFTPSLARMYAARAKQLPQPTKWFCVSNFFRAERPQRGRLREFWQWNCDVIGGEVGANIQDLDAETIAVAVDAIAESGLESNVARVKMSSRDLIRKDIERGDLRPSNLPSDWIRDGESREDAFERVVHNIFALLDVRSKISRQEFLDRATQMGLPTALVKTFDPHEQYSVRLDDTVDTLRARYATTQFSDKELLHIVDLQSKAITEKGTLQQCLHLQGLASWSEFDSMIVRGLAYYTGTVFELIAEGERAVAGGGRYDNLIELFGGPPTPACGFGMGDAVLGNLLEDRKLIPEGREMLEALSRPMPLRPDVFVIASPNPGCEELIVPTVARLRRGEESEKYRQGEAKPWSAERYTSPPLHARRSYKATKNVGKLLSDAGACHARFAAIIESPEKCTLKNMDTGEQAPDVRLDELARRCS